jgi:hypothetical protein
MISLQKALIYSHLAELNESYKEFSVLLWLDELKELRLRADGLLKLDEFIIFLLASHILEEVIFCTIIKMSSALWSLEMIKFRFNKLIKKDVIIIK